MNSNSSSVSGNLPGTSILIFSSKFSFSLCILTNISTNANASTDFIGYDSGGLTSSNYIDVGINGNGFNNPTVWTINGPSDAYVYTGNTNLAVGTGGNQGNLTFFTAGTLAGNERMRITPTGNIGINNTANEHSPTIGNCNCYWYNVNHKGNWNFPHTHPSNVFAAVLYVKADNSSGELKFERPDIMGEYYANRIDYDTEFNRLQYKIKPKEKSLVIFPAWLRHSVEPSLSDRMRLSIAFNIN